MGVDPLILRSFAGGELSPGLAARADLARYQSGLKTCRNFLVQRHGGVSNRPGLRFIGECKTNGSNKRLLRYTHEDPLESVLIEAGEGYLRFWQNGALVTVDHSDVAAWDMGTDYVIGDLVLEGGVVYYCIKNSTGDNPPDVVFWQPLVDDGNGDAILEIATPFSADGLFNWHQSGRVITFTHRDDPPHELIYESLTRWIFQQVDTAPAVIAPTNLTADGGAGSRVFSYVVTAAAGETFEESEPSNVATDAASADPTADAPHELAWTAVVGAEEYYVYCDPYGNGVYGFIGTAAGNSFNNPGTEPDFAITPPRARVLFDAAGGYPHCSATYQQRRLFGNTEDVPDAVYGSRVGFPSNFGISSPLQDDDAITFRTAGNNNHAIQHMLALKHGLILLTPGGEWTVRGAEGRAIIPNGIETEQETYLGATDMVRPVVNGNGIVYAMARGSKVAEIKFDVAVEGLGGRDLTVFAGHLFDGYAIGDMDLAQAPDPIIWCVRSDGVLLGLTYVPEQDVWGWHRHDTAGDVEHVCVLPGDGHDDLFVIVNREIDGDQVRYIEQLERRTILDFNEDAFFLDSGLSYSGGPVSSVSGLDHLEGETVGIVGDGVYLGTAVVSSGAVTLPSSASDVHVGLLYDCDLETCALDVAGTGVRSKRQRVQAIDVVLEASSRAFKAGPDSSHLKTVTTAAYEGTARSFSGKVELTTTAAFADEGRVFLRQSAPLPITVLAVIPQVEVTP